MRKLIWTIVDHKKCGYKQFTSNRTLNRSSERCLESRAAFGFLSTVDATADIDKVSAISSAWTARAFAEATVSSGFHPFSFGSDSASQSVVPGLKPGRRAAFHFQLYRA